MIIDFPGNDNITATDESRCEDVNVDSQLLQVMGNYMAQNGNSLDQMQRYHNTIETMLLALEQQADDMGYDL